MNAERIYYVFQKDDVRDAVQETAKEHGGSVPRVVEFVCGCGCEGAVMFGRNSRALWAASTHSDLPSIRVIGLETEVEVRTFVEGTMRRAPEHSKGLDLIALAEFRQSAAVA